ncbi:putative disease resistance protein At4g10780 [Coffea arabica]|uniref:Disease resistance protein At4g10780 n=1 Tax=Coffea arabica TaxID=13443 RepID=A0ABM4UXI4_COFAR|nr:putative disease resistance protein At4g10780 [Coffea arabica]
MIDKLKDLATDLGVKWLQDYLGLEEKLENLETRINLVKYRAIDMVTLTKLQSGKKRKKEVEEWLKKVERKKIEFRDLRAQVQQARFYSRIQLVRRVETMMGEVEDLVQQGAFSGGLFLDVYDTKGVPLLATTWKGQAFEQNLREIWECVMDDEIFSIGIYGMGGVGKTTLATHVHNNLLKEAKFSGHVCWITVSQEANIHKLQKDIAKFLPVDLSCEDNDRKRAAQLFQALKRRRNFVLILDDVWTHFDLENVGIPLRVDGSKLIITSRSLDVCCAMGCQKEVKVKPLCYQEAWTLFLEKLGCCRPQPPDIEEIAKSMVKNCAGLPLGIITVAGSMKGTDDIHEWRDALEELEDPVARQDCEVFKILHYSYSRLRDQRLKDCFLYCSLYPEDCEIPRDELIASYIRERLVDKRRTRQAEFDQGHALLNKLENACLLEGVVKIKEDDTEAKYVKMHDLMRDMALKITKTKPKYLVKAGIWLRDIPDKSEWKEDLDKVSLRFNVVSSIPLGISPNCPKLSTLSLWGNELTSMPCSFFAHFGALQVLDLSCNRSLEELPNCISELERLTALLLFSCRDLRFVPSLEKLKALRELDLSDTKISDVPEGLEGLVNLKCLNMVQTNLEMISEGIISKLSCLQSLGIPRQVSVQVEELESLKQLEEFIGGFPEANSFSRFVRSRQRFNRPSFYVIQVGSGLLKGLSGHFQQMASKRVVFSFTNVNPGGEKRANILPDDIQELEICACQGLGSCLNDTFAEFNTQTRGLTHCLIEGSSEIRSLLKLSSSEDQFVIKGQNSACAPLQNLKHLRLICLSNFNGLFEWDSVANAIPPPSTFSCLRSLFIDRCGKLKKLFTPRLLQSVQSLEVLKVWGCNELEEIVSNDEEGYFSFTSSNKDSCSRATISCLPNLKKLAVLGNPKLRNICKGLLICNSIERIEVISCRNLGSLPPFLPSINGQPSAPPALKVIQISLLGWESLKWDNPYMKKILQPFVRYGEF